MTRRRASRYGTRAPSAKARITIRLDADVLAWFRKQVGGDGIGYQTLINRALREYVANDREPLEVILRRVIREELACDRTPVLMVADEAEPYGSKFAASRRRKQRGKHYG
jgi:hypothetical protein